MSRVDGGLRLSQITIPGTHDAGATREPLAGTAKTQTLSMAEQLEMGAPLGYQVSTCEGCV
jgi:1-phosphatidylinositol phosphodiesterase